MENCLRMAWQLTLKEISEGCNNKNFVMSPMSIIVALSILAFGSRGRTLEQLLDFLEAKDMDDLKAKASLMMSAAAPVENTKEGLILSSLNGVWIDQRFAMRPSFKEIAETIFKTEANAVDFLNEAEIVRNKVNLWVKNATKGLIKEVLSPGDVSGATIIILANALYFKGAWLYPFKAKRTRPKKIYPLVGEPIKVPFMTGTTEVKHFFGSFEEFKVLKIPYKEGQDNRGFSMYVFLPEEKNRLQHVIQRFNSNPNLLDKCFDLQKIHLSDMLIPKFKFSYGFEAKKIMKNLGLTLPFEMLADFTEINESFESGQVFVSSIVQKSCIEVNEKGTEAASCCYLCLCTARFTSTSTTKFCGKPSIHVHD
ncbi:hypothetical protein ACB092_12G006700 [Castanea dentata]